METHLNSRQIEELLQLGSEGSEAGVLGQGYESARAHLDACGICQERVRAEQEAMGRFAQLRTGAVEAKGLHCPPETVWLELAAGINAQGKEDYLSHAAECDHCGPLLLQASSDLSEEVSAEELQVVQQLRSSQHEWQYVLAQKLTRASGGVFQLAAYEKPRLRTFFALPRLAFGFATLAVVGVFVWIGSHSLRRPSAEQLLAQAYTEHRTFDVRIPGAKFAPIRVERGDGKSNIDKPSSLLKAEALIADKLAENPSNPAWLGEKASADLLDGNYESAIESLQRALEVQPESPRLLADLGAAYFVRAKSADRPMDYGNAVESLSKAIAKSPDDPVALFNRALACEQMFLYTQAVDDWEHYLRVDAQGDWADDARKHLAAVKQRMEPREKSLAEPLLTPEEIVQPNTEQSVLQDRIDGRIEAYLKLAITDWSPKAFSEFATGESQVAESALTTLAEITKERHDDLWLSDLISNTGGSQFHTAIEALAESIRANERGDYVGGRNSAHIAARLFREAANPAGELRSEAEEVYSDHLLWEGDRCISMLRGLDEPLKRSRYAWLQAQMSLEKSNCADLVGDMGTYQAAIIEGTRAAESHKYAALFLRGVGFEALAMASLGKAKESMSLATQGLSLFWTGHADIMKGYNLYTDLDASADLLRLPNLQVALSREATALIDQHPDVLLRAMAHRWYGNAAYLANLPDKATSEFSIASALFAAAPPTAATARDRMDAEVWLAQIEIRQGALERAAARLEGVKPTLETTSSFNPEIGFYTAQAEIAMQKDGSAAAESAQRSAIFLAEWALNSFSSVGDRRQWAEQARDAYRNVVERKLRVGEPAAALELWEWYRGAEYRADENAIRSSVTSLDSANPPDPRDAPAIPRPTVVASQLALLHDETAIAYGTFPDGIAVWVYDDRGIFSRWIAAPLPQVRDLAMLFQRLCSNPNSDLVTLRTTARSLYNLLIAPIERQLVPGRTLLFEPDDPLAAIPWEALLDASAHYLGQRAPVVVTPTLYLRMRLRPSDAITAATPALIVSAPVVEGLVPLSDAENEARAVAARFSSARLLQSDATLSTIRRELRGKVVFHFAGHAVSSPLRSGLVLAERDPSTLQPRVVGGESLAARETDRLQLAVLSACNSGDEAQSTGSGTVGLAQALLHAGVPHVIATRWNVDSSETAKFMGEFYARLLAGNGIAASMHAAQLALGSEPTSAHPYYWSAFELQGIK